MGGPLKRVSFYQYCQHRNVLMKNTPFKIKGLSQWLHFLQSPYQKMMEICLNTHLLWLPVQNWMIRKAAIVLDSCRLYNTFGLGPGIDTHLEKWYSFLLQDIVHLEREKPAGGVVEMSKYTERGPGIYAEWVHHIYKSKGFIMIHA